MNREQLQVALTHVSHGRSQAEMATELAHLQAGLRVRLGCLITAEEARVLWERFSETHYATSWLVVDEGWLNLCAWMLETAYQEAIELDTVNLSTHP